MSRYARQTCLPEVGEQGQALLSAATVLVVGAGGLGSALLPLLAGAGIGHIRVIDPDRVEEHNLHRQVLYRMSDIGRPKAEVAAGALAALNPDCRIEATVARLDPANAPGVIAGADIVVDAADTFAVTYALSDLCHAARKPLISASVLGRTGHVGGFCGAAPSYRAVFPDLPRQMMTCASGGVMGPAVATLGALQAQMVLSVLLDHVPSPLGQMISVDLQNWRLSSFRFDGSAEPGTGPQVIAPAAVCEDDIVIDLRSIAEAPETPFAHAHRMGPDGPDGFTPEPGRRVVFVCASGLRAWHAARQLQDRHAAPVAIVALGS
ncbi:MAG: HesA/MoeB/ThiF family protein [Thalassovita sp.]|nr:HesA/MoeB/ThiF family protein [Thalassovita sp.]